MSTSVRIELDNRGSVFTCLDVVTGRVVLHVASQETISTITVKMEGISRTRLFVPNENENDPHSRRAETEIHKLLYVVDTVFPSPEVLLQRSSSSSSNSSSNLGYTLSQGTYEYPFRLRIPINNKCRPVDSLLQKLSIEKGKVDYARDGIHHAEQILPPSLFGLPGGDFGEDATVKYFLKVTVNRPQFYRTNLRTEEAFVFLPIEPPRPERSGSEVFARRQHTFVVPSPELPPQKKSSIWSFGKKEVKHQVPPPVQRTDLPVLVAARLPAPAILTPTEPLELRILLTKLEPCDIPVYIHQLSLRLVIDTYVTAHTQRRKLTTTIPLHNTQITQNNTQDQSSVSLPLAVEDGSRPINSEIEVDRRIWNSWTLPNNVCPSFSTCNITRTYQLEVMINLSCGRHGIQDKIPLVIPVQIYSGIRPPIKLLERLNISSTAPTIEPNEAKSAATTESHSTTYRPPDQDGHPNVWDLPQRPNYTEAPPAYEDVVLTAEDSENMSADGPHNRNRQYPIQQGYFSEPITEQLSRGGMKA